ncbi:HAD family hydrolase [Methanosphaera cuniculi]|uniref:HAD family hydrolase n=1 Tax=Methanosphaera cuniculi TaxID=1077256 RepID=UPI0026DCEC5D|nr:HAD family hydrolase [Methanosphaera cuniculi]
MKAIVFDNAGTILKRITAIKNTHDDTIFFETNTIGIANKNPNQIIVVFQQPTPQIIQTQKPNTRIYNYMKQNKDKFEISYSQIPITKDELLEKLKKDTTTINQITKTATTLIDKFNIEICSGSALIIDTQKGNINYVFTAGGVFFDTTKSTIKKLKDLNFEVYIASGDNHESLMKIATILGIKKSNTYDTANRKEKSEIVKQIQNMGYTVCMVGNNLNDELALECADISILNLEQKEELPEYLLCKVDHTVNKLSEILDII